MPLLTGIIGRVYILVSTGACSCAHFHTEMVKGCNSLKGMAQNRSSSHFVKDEETEFFYCCLKETDIMRHLDEGKHQYSDLFEAVAEVTFYIPTKTITPVVLTLRTFPQVFFNFHFSCVLLLGSWCSWVSSTQKYDRGSAGRCHVNKVTVRGLLL